VSSKNASAGAPVPLDRNGPDPDRIAAIYEAALDDERWSGIATIVADAVGVQTCGVFIVDHGRVSEISMTSDGLDTVEPYVSHFVRLDLWQARSQELPPDVVRLSCEYLPEGTLVRTEFYNDFARRFGMFRPMGAVVRLAPGVFATASVERTFTRANLFEEADKRRLAPYVPHVKSALQLRRRLGGRQSASTHVMALEALAFGAVILDANGHVVFANDAARALERAAAGIRLGNASRPIEALRRSETRQLCHLVHEAASGGPGGVMRLSDRNGTPALLVLVTPLPRGAHGIHDGGHALLTLRAASDSPAFSEAMLSGLFGLSPAQAAITYALYCGQTPEEIAERRGIRISTLRSHLAQIFQRTGAQSQRDLMRLLALLPPVR
jgi:DNA-binding CsgD family transcriptional regulator